MSRISEADKALVERMTGIRELLAEFEAQLSGFDPGVSALVKGREPGFPGIAAGCFGEHLAFDRTEWEWLEPLLQELRARRRSAADAHSGGPPL